MFTGHDCIFLVEQSYKEGQLIVIFYSLLAASICCHRGRHRCNAVIHAVFEGPGVFQRTDYRAPAVVVLAKTEVVAHLFHSSPTPELLYSSMFLRL